MTEEEKNLLMQTIRQRMEDVRRMVAENAADAQRLRDNMTAAEWLVFLSTTCPPSPEELR